MNIETKCVQGGYTPKNGEPKHTDFIQHFFNAFYNTSTTFFSTL